MLKVASQRSENRTNVDRQEEAVKLRMFVGMLGEMSETEVNRLVEEGIVCSKRSRDVVVLGAIFEHLSYGDQVWMTHAYDLFQHLGGDVEVDCCFEGSDWTASHV